MKHGALVYDCDKLGEIWHKIFSHLHYGALMLLKDIVQGLSDFKIQKLGVCKECAFNKHTNTTFLRKEHRSREILDLIHSNICGPMSLASLTNNIYYVSFTDNHQKDLELLDED
jgi:hypothetical protein